MKFKSSWGKPTPKGHQEDHISHQNGQGHQHDSIGYANGNGHQKFHSDAVEVCDPNEGFHGKVTPRGHQEDHISHLNGVGHDHESTGYANGNGHQKFHGDDMCDLIVDCPCEPEDPEDPEEPPLTD